MEEQARPERIAEEAVLARALPDGIMKAEIKPDNLPVFEGIRHQLNKAFELGLLLRRNITLTPILRQIEHAEDMMSAIIKYAQFVQETTPPAKPRYWVFDNDTAKEVNHDEFVVLTGHDPLTEPEEIDEEAPIAPEVTE